MAIKQTRKSLLTSVFISRIRKSDESSIASGITMDRDIAGTSQAVKNRLLSKNSFSSGTDKGHYIPQLDVVLLSYNSRSRGFKFNVQGIAKMDPESIFYGMAALNRNPN